MAFDYCKLNKPAKEFQAGENIGFNIRAGVRVLRSPDKERMDKLQRRCICQAGSASGYHSVLVEGGIVEITGKHQG